MALNGLNCAAVPLRIYSLTQCISDNRSVTRKPKDNSVHVSAAAQRFKKHRRPKKEAAVTKRLPQLHSNSDSDLPLLTWWQHKLSNNNNNNSICIAP